MPPYEYLTLPFAGSTKENDKNPATTLAKQLNGLINKTTSKGWEFYRVDHVSIFIKNGCLATLAGQPFTKQDYDMVTFRRSSA